MSNQYTCAECHQTFDKGWSDEEARAEYDQKFNLPIEMGAIVCDDCYKKLMNRGPIMPWPLPEEPK